MGSIPGLGRSLEEEMPTHSSILSCRILWAEEPGGLEPIGLQRVEHDSELKQLSIQHTCQTMGDQEKEISLCSLVT